MGILSHIGGVDALRNRLEQLGRIWKGRDTRNTQMRAPQPPQAQVKGGTIGKIRENVGCNFCVCNDPSAGSPTETLLRLLLPLNDKV